MCAWYPFGMLKCYGILSSILKPNTCFALRLLLSKSFISCREPTIEELSDASGFSRIQLQRLLRLQASHEVFSGALYKLSKGKASGDESPVRTGTLNTPADK